MIGRCRFARCTAMEIQNRRWFPASFKWRSFAAIRAYIYRYANIYFVLDSVRKLSEAVSRATFGPQTSAGELFSALCLDLSLPKVSNCFWEEKSRGTQKYIIAGRDWYTQTLFAHQDAGGRRGCKRRQGNYERWK